MYACLGRGRGSSPHLGCHNVPPRLRCFRGMCRTLYGLRSDKTLEPAAVTRHSPDTLSQEKITAAALPRASLYLACYQSYLARSSCCFNFSVIPFARMARFSSAIICRLHQDTEQAFVVRRSCLDLTPPNTKYLRSSTRESAPTCGRSRVKCREGPLANRVHTVTARNAGVQPETNR